MKYQQEVQILDQFQHLRTTKIMEGGKPSPHSFHLKKVLKSYQLTAANTLSGPSSFLSNGDPASATTAQNSATTPAPSNSSGGNSNSTLIIKTNYVDPNGFIHGNQGGNRIPGAKGCLDDDEVIVVDRDDEQELQQVYLRRRESSPTGNFAMNFSDTSSSTSSTSASPISHHGGGNYEAGVVSPPPPGKGTKSERTSPIRETGGGGRKSSCGQLAPSLPLKKLMHRHSSPPVGGIKEEQQRSLQAAIILASGLQHHHVKNGGDGGGHNHQQGMMQPPPILSASDRSTTEKRETPLEGVFISCFVVGGEKRLCFPHILTTVLKPFSLPQINQVCDELQIFCSRCSPEQLEVLKVTGVLPMGAHSCGLITKTDAERLVNALLHRNPPKAAVGSVAARSGAAASSPNNAFRVYHKCFGKCKGIVLSNLYDRMDSLCIECVECHGLFSPARFVAHSHHRQEVRTCHWGFDSSKWRHYLLLDRDEDPEKWTKSLAEFKGKFEQKRKESAASSSCEESYGGWNGDEHLVIKRVRYSSGVETPLITSPTNVPTDPAALYLPKKRLSSSYNIQYSDNNNDQNHVNETEAVKKMLLSQLGSDGAEPVIKLLDKLTGKISSLEKICKSQDQQLRRSEPNHHQTGATDLQRKVNTMEAELHSLKKQLLRRHEAR